jgi:hypothetical protein
VTATNANGTAGPVERSGNAVSVSGDAALRDVTIREAGGQSVTLPAPASVPAASPAPAPPPPTG